MVAARDVVRTPQVVQLRSPKLGVADEGSSSKRQLYHPPLVVTIANLLNAEYQGRDLGNKPDPIDELVYISLTRQTHRQNAVRSWEAVVTTGGPRALLDIPLRRLTRLLRPSGFASQKARWIKQSLRKIVKTMGELSLKAAEAWDNQRLERFLRSLPGISIKSAKCIMMYSMGRQVLPVDVHLRRLVTRIGLVPAGLSERLIHTELERIVPLDLRYGLHVNAIWHGRAICTAFDPRCHECVLRAHCRTGRRLRHQRVPADGQGG